MKNVMHGYVLPKMFSYQTKEHMMVVSKLHIDHI